ncbi:MAG: tetratricopeptide repeat protein [Phycisphaeraceae bacterium JB051]
MIFGRKKSANPTEDPKSDDQQTPEKDEQAADTGEQTPAESDGKKKGKLGRKAGAKADKSAKKEAIKRDPAKAMTFFRHASTVAEARNYDYSIQLYLDGLSHDPDNMNKHEALREVALRRKVAGGKPAKMFDRWKVRGKDKVEKALQSEYHWSKNPLNFNAAITVMERCVEAFEDQDEYNMGEVAYWIGILLLEKSEMDKQLNKQDLLKLTDLFERIDAYHQAVNACRWALELDRDDYDLESRLKDLQAEETMIDSGYGEQIESAEVDFKKTVRDMSKQQELDQENQLSKTEQAIEDIINRSREAFEANPDDMVLREKFIKALLDKRDDATEGQAIKLLEEAYAKSQDFKYKRQVVEIQLRKVDRIIKKLKAAVIKDNKNQELVQKYKLAIRQKVKMEINLYTECTKQYPTDRKWKYDLGRVLFSVKQYDKAVEQLQQAVSDAKYRVQSLLLLGQCYLAQDWFDEAIDTLEKAVEAHKSSNDKIALEIRYHWMIALEKSAVDAKDVERAKEAQKIASEILQTDINFKDIRQHMERIRGLVKELAAS